jgi:hypothetical protein
VEIGYTLTLHAGSMNFGSDRPGQDCTLFVPIVRSLGRDTSSISLHVLIHSAIIIILGCPMMDAKAFVGGGFRLHQEE